MSARGATEASGREVVRLGARSRVTREAILDAAERLFAEQGLRNVSQRDISSAAGQGNVAAVNYHFGSTAGLVEAIVSRHSAPIEQLRLIHSQGAEGSDDLRDWLGCLIYPIAEHLDLLGNPTWWARLSAQLVTDPQRARMAEAVMGSTTQQTVRRIKELLPDLPEPVRVERSDMTRLLAVHVFAEREAALATGQPTPRGSWRECADGLVDATAGLWAAVAP